MSDHFHIFSHFLWTIKSGWRCDVRCVQSDYYHYWHSKKEMHTKDLCQDHKLHTFTLTTLTFKTFVLAEQPGSWSNVNEQDSMWFNNSLTRLNANEQDWRKMKNIEVDRGVRFWDCLLGVQVHRGAKKGPPFIVFTIIHNY